MSIIYTYMTFTHHIYNYWYLHTTLVFMLTTGLLCLTLRTPLSCAPYFGNASPPPWDLTLHKSQHSQSWKAQLDQKNWTESTGRMKIEEIFIVSLEGTLYLGIVRIGVPLPIRGGLLDVTLVFSPLLLECPAPPGGLTLHLNMQMSTLSINWTIQRVLKAWRKEIS